MIATAGSIVKNISRIDVRGYLRAVREFGRLAADMKDCSVKRHGSPLNYVFWLFDSWTFCYWLLLCFARKLP